MTLRFITNDLKMNNLVRGDRLHQILGEIKLLRRSANEHYFRLGCLMKEIRDEELWKDSYESFYAFCADPEIDFSVSHVKNAITLVERFPDQKEIEGIGYSKLIAIGPHLKEGNEEELIEMARNLSRSDLRHELEARKQKDDRLPEIPKIWRCGSCGGVKGVVFGDLCRCRLTDESYQRIKKILK